MDASVRDTAGFDEAFFSIVLDIILGGRARGPRSSPGEILPLRDYLSSRLFDIEG